MLRAIGLFNVVSGGIILTYDHLFVPLAHQIKSFIHTEDSDCINCINTVIFVILKGGSSGQTSYTYMID